MKCRCLIICAKKWVKWLWAEGKHIIVFSTKSGLNLAKYGDYQQYSRHSILSKGELSLLLDRRFSSVLCDSLELSFIPKRHLVSDTHY